MILVIASAVLSADDQNILRAQQWLAKDKTEQFNILSQAYAKPPEDLLTKDQKALYQIGEALFRTPTLLGGQAAKARISCNSCHLSGGDNPAFQFPNISGAPGTADVTNSFFSSFRGNQNFDPLPIPDLRKTGKISKDPNKPMLRNFIRNLIVEEFNGKEPNMKALDALTFYVQKIDANIQGHTQKKYPQDRNRIRYLSVQDPIKIIENSVNNITLSIIDEDYETADLLIASVRHQLGLIYERYQHPKLKKEQQKILQASHDLSQLKYEWAARDPNQLIEIQRKIANWEIGFAKTGRQLIKKEKFSLYNILHLQSSLTKPQ